jgi:transcriptional regulator with GAF, ATPase, and Fis domain
MDTRPGTRPDISVALVAAARTLTSERSLDRTLDAIARTALASAPGADHVVISTVDDDGRLRTVAATDPDAGWLDELQHALGEGPYVDALRQRQVVVAPRIREDPRWPHYVPRAVSRLGLRAQLTVRLSLDDGTLGGLSLYSSSQDELHPDAPRVAELCAVQAALALGAVRQASALKEALETRRLVGVAVGIVRARYDMSEERALAFLFRVSSHGSISLRQVAQEVVDSGSRPR